jgi:hypothetical protein
MRRPDSSVAIPSSTNNKASATAIGMTDPPDCNRPSWSTTRPSNHGVPTFITALKVASTRRSSVLRRPTDQP